MNCFQKIIVLSKTRTNLGAFCPKMSEILSENVFFRTKLGQKFVKYAQKTLECQMNIVGWFSDKWIFRWLDFLYVYVFLMVKRGWCIGVSCFHKFSLELLIL